MKTLFIFVILLMIPLVSKAQFYTQWTKQTSGTTQDLYSVSTSMGWNTWACGANGTVLMSLDLGETWQSVGSSSFSTLSLYNICSINTNSALVTGSDGTGTYVYKTTNSGGNWTQVFFQAGGFINGMYVDDLNNQSYMQGDPVGGRWSLWKSTNRGTTWDSSGMYLPQSGSEAGWNNSFVVKDFNDIYFGTNNSRIYKSPDGGTNWVVQNTPDVNSYSMAFVFSSGISGGSQLMRTENEGSNWNLQSSPGSGNILGTASANYGFWYARGSGLYSSFNGGLTWNTDTTISGTQFNGMSSLITLISRSGYRIWAVGNDGIIYANDYLNSISQISSTLPEMYSLSQNYPNP